MNILFENKYTRNKEWAKNINGYIYFRRPIFIVFTVLLILWTTLWTYSAIVEKHLSITPMLCLLLWIGIFVFAYFRNTKLALKRDLELHGKPIEVTVEITDDTVIQTQSTGSEFKLSYDDIKKIVQTKKFIYLWSKTNMLYSLKKNSFSIGTYEDFILFLKSKNLKVK